MNFSHIAMARNHMETVKSLDLGVFHVSVCIHVRLPQSVLAIMRMTKISKSFFLQLLPSKRETICSCLYTHMSMDMFI